MIRKLYPGGRKKAFNISYDDGVEQDVRFVQLLNQYGIKGTFNLNSGLMKQRFQWVHECGLTVKRLPEEAVTALYEGHEVASHSYSHPYMDSFSQWEILKELGSDRFFLEALFGQEIRGYATPFYFYNELLEKCVRECGFAYARISEESGDYSIPTNFYRWKAGKFHWDDDLEAFVEGFLHTDQELAICQIVGHSYDLDVMDMWERMERLLGQVNEAEDVWKCTHIQLVDYLREMDKAVITTSCIRNESTSQLWFDVNDNIIMLAPGEKEEIL